MLLRCAGREREREGEGFPRPLLIDGSCQHEIDSPPTAIFRFGMPFKVSAIWVLGTEIFKLKYVPRQP